MYSSRCFHVIAALLLTAIATVQALRKEGDFMVGGLFPVNFQGTSGRICGELNTKGIGRVLSALFAIEKVNGDPKILPNMTIGYDIRVYCEDSAEATRMTYGLLKDMCLRNITQRKMDNKSIVALIGPEESSTVLAINALLQTFNVPGISGTTTSPELSLTVTNFYKTVPSDTFRVTAMADIIEHFNWTYIAAVGIYNSYGQSGVWGLMKEASKRNYVFCVAMASFITEERSAITDVVTKLRQQNNIKAIVMWTYGNVQRTFFEEVSKQNMSGRVWILSEVTFSSNDVFLPRSGLSPLHGSLAFQPHNFDDGGFKEYLRLLLTKEAKKQVDHFPHLWNRITAVYSNCSHQRKSKDPYDNRKSQSCLHEVVNDTYSSYIPYIIDAVYSVAHALEIVTRDCHKPDGKFFQNLSLNYCKSEITESFSRVNFVGLTGRIEFDEFGERQLAVYDIINFQQVEEAGVRQLKQIKVGEWNTTKRLRFYKAILWGSQSGSPPRSDCLGQCKAGTRKIITSPCCWQCVPCPHGTVNSVPGAQSCIECPRGKRSNEAKTECEDLPLANFKYSSPGGIVVIVFCSWGIIASLFMIATICKFWNSPIVKASNREISLLLLVGVILLLFLVFFNIFEPTETLCKVVYPWRYTTYNLCLSLMVIKVLRISSAFQVPLVGNFTISSLSNRIQVLIVITLQIVLVFVLLPWMALDPPVYMQHIYPELYILNECKAYSTLVGKSLFLLTCSYVFIQMLLTSFCFFKVRSIPENFSEVKRIAFSLYIFSFSLLCYHPVEFSMKGWYVTVVDCVTTLLSVYGFLCCIFLPKAYILLFRPEVNNLSSIRQEVTQFSFGSRCVRVNPVFHSSNREVQA